MKTKLFTLMLAVAAGIGTMFAEKVQIGDLYYNLDATSQTAEVTSQNSSYPYWSTTITTANIPASVEYNSVTYSVTSIGEWAFQSCSSLTSITIPNSVTSIGKYAFQNCSSLTSLTIGNSVTSIGSSAFSGCSGLTSVTIPNSVTSIGSSAFSGVFHIAYNGSATGSPWGATYINKYVEGWLIYEDSTKTAILKCINTVSGHVEIPNSVTSIGYDAFWGCDGLTSVTIPNSVTSIGTYAFYYCTGLTSVTIGNSVTSIGRDAFSGCSGLTSVTIPNSVTSIGEWAFSGCSGLTSVTIPNSVTSIGNNAFRGCSGLTSPVYNAHVFAFMPTSYSGAYTIPDGIEFIAGGAFSGCTGLTSLTIPNSDTSIGDRAFQDCSGLTSIDIPNSVTSIGYDAFRGCSGLTSLKLSAMLEEPDRNSAYTLIAGCYRQGGSRDPYQQGYEWVKNLISIEAPAWFFDVPETDWIYCPRHLQHVAVNNGELTESALNAINQSYKTLQTLDVSGVTNTEFADEAFKGYYNLQQLVLPEGLQKVSYMMVAGCKNLQSIDIPASVEEIEQSAFEDCRSIKTITFGGAPAGAPGRFNAPATSASQLKKIGNWAFYNAHELQHLDIPEGVTEIGDGAFYGCTYLEDMTLPASVQAIGDNCFALCAKLKKITCNAVTPPTIEAKTFFDVKRQIPVYVPDEAVSAYENDTYWQEFDIQGQSDTPQGVEEVPSDQVQSTKVLHNGQIFILRGEKVYTVQGQEVN